MNITYTVVTELKWRAHALLHTLFDHVECEEECTNAILSLAQAKYGSEVATDHELQELVDEFLRLVVELA